MAGYNGWSMSNNAVEAYANFAMGPTATEEDLVKYAFA